MSSPASSSEPRHRLGRYTLISEIARGTFGRLWTAYSKEEGEDAEPVLIRRLWKRPPLDEASLDEIRQAAELTRSIRGAHVASVLGIDESEEELGVVYGYAEGKDLRSLLSLAPLKHSRVPPGVAVNIMGGALAGLSELESELAEELRTATLWPDSVFVRVDGRTQLFDAGVAAALARSPLPAKNAQLLSYAAPEEFEGGALDRCDVFRAGILLWEMVTGKRLFSGHTTKATIDQVLNAPIPAIEWGEATPARLKLEDVIRRALDRVPSRRYANPAELGSALAECGIEHDTDVHVAGYLMELVATGLAAQQRAVKTALSGAVDVTDTIPMTAGANPAAVFPHLVGVSATSTLIGVPEPAVLPAKKPLPPPPRRPPPTPGAPLEIASLDDVEAPLRQSLPGPTEDSSVTLLDDLQLLEPEPEPARMESITDLMDRPPVPPLEPPDLPLEPSDVPLEAPPPSLGLFEPIPPEPAPAIEGQAAPIEASEEEPRRGPLKRSHLVGLAAALGILLLSAVVFAWLKSGSPEKEASTAGSAAASSGLPNEPEPATAGGPAPAKSLAVEAPASAPSASAAEAEPEPVASAAPDAEAEPAPKAALMATPGTKSAPVTEKSAVAVKPKTEAAKKAAAAKKKKAEAEKLAKLKKKNDKSKAKKKAAKKTTTKPKSTTKS